MVALAVPETVALPETLAFPWLAFPWLALLCRALLCRANCWPFPLLPRSPGLRHCRLAPRRVGLLRLRPGFVRPRR